MAFSRLDHDIGICQGEGHRLLDQDVLTPLQGEQGMCSMKLVWGRNIDRIHIGTSTQRLCTLVRLPVKLTVEFLQLAWVDIGGGGELDVRVLHKSRNHVTGAPSQPNNPHAQGRPSLAITSSSGHGSTS